LGTKNKPDFRALAVAYKELGAEQKASLKRDGRRATQRNRNAEVEPGHSSFGLDRRAHKAQAHNRLRAAEIEATVQLAEEAGNAGRPQKQLRLCPRRNDGGEVLEAVCMPVDSQDSRAEANQLRKENIIMRAAEEVLEARREANRADWVATKGEEMKWQTCQLSPQLATRAAEFEPMPDSTNVDIQHLHWKTTNVVERVKKALAYDPEAKSCLAVSKLKDGLDSLWTGVHTSVQHTDMECFKNDAGPIHRPCHEEHMHVCEGQGKLALKMRKALGAVLRRLCPPKSPRRVLLNDSRVFGLCQGYMRIDGPADAAGALPLQHVASEWAHISNVDLTQFTFSAHRVLRLGLEGRCIS